MGRLEDIIARHEARHRPTAKTLIWGAFAILLVASVLALLFTDLATPTIDPKPAPAAAPKSERVDGVLLRRAPAAHR